MEKHIEEVEGADLDALVDAIVGRTTTNAEIHALMEAAGHYVATNPERLRRDDPRYFTSPVGDGRLVFGPSHLVVMKRAFVAAHRGMLVDVS